MNDLSCGLTYVSETYLWLETYEDLRRFVTAVLNLKGKWKAPGGDVKSSKAKKKGDILLNGLVLVRESFLYRATMLKGILSRSLKS